MAFSVNTAGNSTAENVGKVRRFFVASAHATFLAPGDQVRLTGTSDTEGVAAVDAVTATAQQIAGVIASVEYQVVGENLSNTGLPAGTAGYVYVHTDPALWFLAPVANGPLVAADVGLNVDGTYTASTRVGGMSVSTQGVNATGKATTATLQYRVQGLLPDANGVLGNVALVSINNQTATGV
jgi:hypothetical protein